MEKHLEQLTLETGALQLCLAALARSLPQEFRSTAIQHVEATLRVPEHAEKIADTPGLSEEIRRMAYLFFAED